MGITSDQAGDLLRARGLRSTPQRRVILSVFSGGRTEHLSADEVYALAARSLPDLSRATVYATLAEFSELGLLSSFGSPEPVRYETNVDPHSHFRCHLCLRIFDLRGARRSSGGMSDAGFVVQRVETRAEGVCAECTSYGYGLEAGVSSIRDAGPPATLAASGTAVSEIDSPVGPLLLAATPSGLTRVAFEDHADADDLRAHASSRRGSKAAHQHNADATESLRRYFRGDCSSPDCTIDWSELQMAGPSALMAAATIPYATHRSYSDLGLQFPARELGHLFGANPIPIVMPCHRVSRGTEIPTTFVGGASRRYWLEDHERTHAET